MASEHPNKLQEIKGNIEDLRKRKFDLVSKRDELEQGDLCTTFKVKLGYLKQQFSLLKNTAIELQSKLKLLECLAESEDKWPDTSQEDADFKAGREHVRELKEQMDDKKAKLLEDLDHVEKAYRTYSERVHTLTEEMKEVETKKSKLDASLQNSAMLNEKLGLLNGNKESNEIPQLPLNMKEKEKELKEVQESIKQCEEATHEAKEKMIKFQGLSERLQGLLGESKKELEEVARVKKIEDQKAKRDLQWYDKALSQMSVLSGFKEHSVSGNTLTIEYMNSGDNEDSKLLLSMTWKLGKYGSYVLAKAEINLESLDVTDIIDYAVEKNDVVYMISEIQKAWEKHLPLRKEIVDLRQLYAIDWIPSEGLIRQMVGEGGHIVCTLKVDSTAQGAENVTLVKVEGSKEDNLDSLKPGAEEPSIYEWLEHLQRKFGKP
ncbi:myosin heavy chain, muscle [Lingula anatina]|uniref:Myosin heavy chain, muscle n=1 Tax=Lingula anatina TaxID=7574 RepID=A0A1S3IJ65_LINAN|nr:myosin heavy chain, muscle [Lingula anatina]|eukprot:XP_013398153.1 myosin heavy chain, muscle [Lingula anatina]